MPLSLAELCARGDLQTRVDRKYVKYAVGLAALAPELPANRWARTLRRWYPQS